MEVTINEMTRFNVSTTLVPKTTLETKEVFNLNFFFLQVYKCHQSESWRKT